MELQPEKSPVNPPVGVNPANYKPYPDRNRRWRRISPQVRQRGTVLFDQQMWCWGQDIRACSTNALLQYGFTRHHPPGDPNPKLHNSTSYILEKPGPDGAKIILWGFGLLYQNCQHHLVALYLGRYDFAPKLLGPDLLTPEYLQTWTAATKPRFSYPSTTDDWREIGELLQAALTWVIEYEQWVIQNFGLTYRERCVQNWLRPIMPPLAALDEWRWLIEQTRRFGR